MSKMESGQWSLPHWCHAVQARYRRLPSRDRMALLVLAVFLLLLLLWQGAWAPMRAALQGARADVTAEQALQAHLRSNAPRLAVRGHAAGKLGADQLPALLTAGAAKRGITLAQVQPRPDKRVSIALQGAPEDVVGWLDELQSAGVALVEVALEQDSNSVWHGELLLATP